MMLSVMRETGKRMKSRMFAGEVTVKKTNLWMAAALLMMSGILAGLFSAPLTHGITISCGNNSGNHNTRSRGDEDYADKEDGK